MAAGDLFPVSKPCVEKAGAPKSHNHLFIPIVKSVLTIRAASRAIYAMCVRCAWFGILSFLPKSFVLCKNRAFTICAFHMPFIGVW